MTHDTYCSFVKYYYVAEETFCQRVALNIERYIYTGALQRILFYEIVSNTIWDFEFKFMLNKQLFQRVLFYGKKNCLFWWWCCWRWWWWGEFLLNFFVAIVFKRNIQSRLGDDFFLHMMHIAHFIDTTAKCKRRGEDNTNVIEWHENSERITGK